LTQTITKTMTHKYFLTIWLKDDTKQERGMGRWFDNPNDAIRRFVEIQEDLYAGMIERITGEEEECIFGWFRFPPEQ